MGDNTSGLGPPPYPNVLSLETPPLQRTGVALIFFFPTLSIIVFGLRFYTRLAIRQLGIDDLLCGLALLFAILLTAPLYMYCKLGYKGWRAKDVPDDFDPAMGLWWNFLVQMFYNPVLALVKASILVFLLRLGGHKTGIRACIVALLFINGAQGIAVFFTALFQCIPLQANWYTDLQSDANTVCIDVSFHVIASCITIVTDCLVVALPFWIFLGLNMQKALKYGTLAVLCGGSVVTIIAIIRVVSIYNMFYAPPLKDAFYDISLVYAPVEVNLAIICASIPALRPLLRRWFPSLFSSTAQSAPSDTQRYHHLYGETSRRMRATPSGDTSAQYALQDMSSRGQKHSHSKVHTSSSPTGSEEAIVSYNGIIRTTNFNITYENKTSQDVFEDPCP